MKRFQQQPLYKKIYLVCKWYPVILFSTIKTWIKCKGEYSFGFCYSIRAGEIEIDKMNWYYTHEEGLDKYI